MQRVIKYFAIALAVVLIVTIFSGIVGGIALVGRAVWGDEMTQWTGPSEWTGMEYADNQVRELDINVKATGVKVRTVSDGESVRVETNNEYITTWIDDSNKKLNVVEKSHGFFGWGGTGDVVIYVKEGVKFDDVNIVVGAGTLSIEELEAKKLKLDLGAGKTDIGKLKVSDNADIEGGAGKIDIQNGAINNLRLDIGAGKADVRAKLTGNNRVKSGVGKTDLYLVGEEKDYKVVIDKGLGSVTANGMSLSDGAIFGTGSVLVEVESGVGAVDIKTVEE